MIGVPIAPVWGSKNLLKPPDVRAFMKQYTKDNVENSLKDLNGVDFWWILATNTKEFPGIFIAFMKVRKLSVRKLSESFSECKFSVRFLSPYV